jgi:putative peptidoglycan lipid II flippase
MLAFFSLGIPAMTAWQIVTRVFYSLQDTVTPLRVSFLQIIIDIAFLLTLPRILGYKGLPLATSLSISIGFLILWLVLYNKLPEIREENIFFNFLKVFAMCLVEGLILYLVFPFLSPGHNMGIIKQLVALTIAGTIGTCSFLLTGFATRFPGIEFIIAKFNKKNTIARKLY